MKAFAIEFTDDESARLFEKKNNLKDGQEFYPTDTVYRVVDNELVPIKVLYLLDILSYPYFRFYATVNLSLYIVSMDYDDKIGLHKITFKSCIPSSYIEAL